ncbi:hypothetical protein LAV_00064 [Sphingobium phage Lacusarx]|uniref:SAM-dependent methyltransferase n=1 Tax=Sphingobium phage Lacusarx TaxID=1980139 RepID=A0A1W6DX30_9CAUD|nr:DNA methyltransferase [Sphingobium phage Lacusarx]ARK07464.1 hypothetical protein LAV_00064 [Sphingobium phage Lacusarx]
MLADLAYQHRDLEAKWASVGTGGGGSLPRVDADAAEEILRRQEAARRDSAMLGDSGYERIAEDFYPTPPENVDCLLEHISFHQLVWEPACGNGAISKRLGQFGHTVISTDLNDQGYGEPGKDFLTATGLPMIKSYGEDAPYVAPRAIITNPPYADGLAEKFCRHAIKLMEPVKGQVAMFLRNEFDSGAKRMDLFGLPPFHKKIVVTKRPRWIEGSTGSPRHNYSWFIWDWRHVRGPASISYSHPKTAKPVFCAQQG